MFGFGDKPYLGIDIGSSAVKVALLKKSKKGYDLLNFGMVSLPPDSIVDGAVENPEAVVDALKKLIQAEKLSGYRECVFTISGQSVIIKKITVPLMSEEDLAQSIQQEAEQYIPFDIEEVNVDFQVVKAEGELPKKGEKAAEGDDRQMDVLLVAAKKDIIKDQVTLLQQAGLKPVLADLDVFALENCFELNMGLDVDDTFALINIGAYTTNLNIIEQGITAFTRDIPSGGAMITEAIQKGLNVANKDAESIKMGHLPDRVNKSDVVANVRQGITALCKEISSTLDNFHKSSDGRVRRLYISGGGAMMEGVDSLITKEIGLECKKINPFKNLKVNTKNFDPEYLDTIGPMAAIAIGLATRTLDDK